MSDRHILAQTTHQRHLVTVNSVNDTSGTQEQAGLKHSVSKQVEHTSHVTQLSMVVEHGTMVTWQRYAKGNHHERNLRDG